MVASRREARERALELLYEAELKGVNAAELFRDLPIRPDDWTVGYVLGVDEQRQAVDAEIERHLRADWRLDRIAVIDRLIIRMGVWELRHGDAPTPVVLAEAVELAKRYGGEQSSRFVNGMLAAVAADVQPG